MDPATSSDSSRLPRRMKQSFIFPRANTVVMARDLPRPDRARLPGFVDDVLAIIDAAVASGRVPAGGSTRERVTAFIEPAGDKVDALLGHATARAFARELVFPGVDHGVVGLDCALLDERYLALDLDFDRMTTAWGLQGAIETIDMTTMFSRLANVPVSPERAAVMMLVRGMLEDLARTHDDLVDIHESPLVNRAWWSWDVLFVQYLFMITSGKVPRRFWRCMSNPAIAHLFPIMIDERECIDDAMDPLARLSSPPLPPEAEIARLATARRRDGTRG